MIEIKVLKDYAEVAYQQPGSNKQVRKIVNVSDIPALFETKVTYDSGILPLFGQQNAYGIQRIIQKDNSIIVLVQAINPYVNILHTQDSELDTGTRIDLGIGHITIPHSDIVEYKGDYTCYKNVYFPNLLMSLHLQKNSQGRFQLGGSGLLGFKDPFLTDETDLYDIPFSNTHKGGSHGGICWGDERVVIDSLSQSVGVIHRFLGSVMNDHLFEEFMLKDWELQCSSELLAYLALRSAEGEITSFPWNDLDLQPLIKYKGLIAYLNQYWK
jgi:hypothetical protein